MRKPFLLFAAAVAVMSLPARAQSVQLGGEHVHAVGRPLAEFNTDSAAERIENLATLKNELKKYHDCTCKCGCYAQDLEAQADRAIEFLRRGASERKNGQKQALILDIDETTLSNYQELVSLDFGFDRQLFDAWALSAKAPAIPGTLRLVNEARQLGVAVFFITGRPADEREATERNLREQGFEGWQQLTLRPAHDSRQTAGEYKSAVRAGIVAQGYALLLNVGDQWSDLNGSPEAEYNVKYPDPFYFIP